MSIIDKSEYIYIYKKQLKLFNYLTTSIKWCLEASCLLLWFLLGVCGKCHRFLLTLLWIEFLDCHIFLALGQFPHHEIFLHLESGNSCSSVIEFRSHFLGELSMPLFVLGCLWKGGFCGELLVQRARSVLEFDDFRVDVGKVCC